LGKGKKIEKNLRKAKKINKKKKNSCTGKKKFISLVGIDKKILQDKNPPIIFLIVNPLGKLGSYGNVNQYYGLSHYLDTQTLGFQSVN